MHEIKGGTSANVMFLSSNSLESGRWTKSENPLILCVIHDRQNRIEPTSAVNVFNTKHTNRSLTLLYTS
jgi:hypothetical protein